MSFAHLILCVSILLTVSDLSIAQTPPIERDPTITSWPKTRPERTEHRESSSLQDVEWFLDELQKRGASFTREVIGQSVRNRDLLLVTVADPPTTPVDARRAGKMVVYIQANIHGGEVEGKESVQVLLRQIAQGRHAAWLEQCVLLITPIYNVDGNEALGDGRRNRPNQNGPAIIGRRPNGQGLDLNRDCIKAESPEMRAVLEAVYGRWDPDVIIDLHATNGTRHGYGLTYSPPLDPNTVSPVLEFARDELLPEIRRRLAPELQTFDYGNFRGKKWSTFGPEPRYATNYAGTRNRIGLLSEAMSYLPFDERIAVTNLYVTAILDRLCEVGAPKIRDLIRIADQTVIGWGTAPEEAPELGVRFELASRGVEGVLLEDPEQKTGPGPTKPGPSIEVEAEIFDRFRATETARFPGAYFIPASQPELITLLRRHGIQVERLRQEWSGPIDSFAIETCTTAERPFQGHYLVRLA
ncbi:MAG: M14 family metallopeptidase [Planctomycetota bacterium]